MDNIDCSKLIFVDLHIHSKYSRACSKDLTIENLVKWARVKGLNLLGTGDFTHPLWIKEIEKLKEDNGIYWYLNGNDKFPFMLSSEISLIYTKNGKGRKVHLVYLAPSLEVVKKINSWLDSKGRRDYDGRPIFGISCKDFAAKMEEIDEKIEVIPAHAWTPWFGIFGSEGGFDKLSDAFEDKTYLIHAIETGISSDPEMNWKIRELDNKALVSFSDAHSFWPWRLGREATIFYKSDKLSYDSIINQIREKSFFGTIEAEPAYGKYHFDGHRNCNFSCSYEETKKLNGKCPICGKMLTLGVDYRVNELSKLGAANHVDKKFYYKILPLHEIIALALDMGVNSKGVWKIYYDLINKFENEFNVLLKVSYDEVYNIIGNKLLSELILLNRQGKIEVKPGYDGVYGKAVICGREVGIEEDSPEKSQIIKKEKDVQKKLF
ncbi:MAG: endonuclease Q family protein [Candidatus Nanoarchaeia archaeon]|nr:endonuclease Q family protein [Candidatus Nanoarchaeia archaeon]